jgi:predicted Zn-dependent protease
VAKYQQSLALFREAVAQLADNPEVNYHLGMAAYMMGDKELARKRCRSLQAPSRTSLGRSRSLRVSRCSHSRDNNSLKLSPDDLKKTPRDPAARYGCLVRLGEAYEEQKAPDKAASAYQSALHGQPEASAGIAAARFAQCRSASQSFKALELARSARDLAPNDPGVAASVGQIALKGGNYVWALSLLQDGVRGNPQNPVVRVTSRWPHMRSAG